MIIPILLFLFDFFCWNLLEQWIVYSLMAYFVVYFVRTDQVKFDLTLSVCLIGLMLQDFIVYGLVGVGLLFWIPVFFLIARVRGSLLHAAWLLFTVILISFFIAENSVFCRFILARQPSILVTIMKIFINLIIGYVVFWGSLGNRSLSKIMVRGRKVWTPSRKDAS